jgi:hypothetical protein
MENNTSIAKDAYVLTTLQVLKVLDWMCCYVGKFGKLWLQ